VPFASDAPLDPGKGPMYTRTTIVIVEHLDLAPHERRANSKGHLHRIAKLP
jgi:hypothetical protein